MAITPNQITALRVALALVAVALFGHNALGDLAALGLIVAAIALDAVDGHLARRKGLATPLGAQIDILGDRVIENVFFTYFAVCGLVWWWVPVVFFVRGTLTDFVRNLAARSGPPGTERTPFGKNSMLESRWARALVASQVSRGAYGALKCACFCALGLELTLLRAPAAGLASLAAYGYPSARWVAQILVVATVAFCLVRGLPVLWEGRRYLAAFAGSARSAPGRVRLPQTHAQKTRAPAQVAGRGFRVPQGVAGR